MTRLMDSKSACLVQLAVLLLVILAIGQPSSAQTPELTDLTLESESGINSVNDALSCTYLFSGSTTAAGVAWYRNGLPTMSLYLPFEGGATNALNDYSGSGNNTSLVGTLPWTDNVGNESTGAFEYDGSNYLDAGNSFPTNSSYTTVMWAYPYVIGASSFPLGSAEYRSPGHAMRIGYDGRLTAGHNNNWRLVQTEPLAVSANEWSQFAVTFDVNTRIMTLYLNGQPVDTTELTMSYAIVSDPTVQIAAHQSVTSYTGVLDDVRIYNDALSEDQIAALYASGGQDHIAATENTVGDVWQARVTPFSSTEAGPVYVSNDLTIVPTLPVITSIAQVAAIVDKPYSYQLTATGGPVPTFSVTSGPAGMTVDANSGLVSWTPSTSGTFSVTLTATNSEGSDDQSFDIEVADPTVGVANVVLTADLDGNLISSNDLTLSATTSSTTWLKDGEPLLEFYMPAEGGPMYALEDYSGHGRNTIPVGDPTWVPNGSYDGNGAWDFDGDDYLNVGDHFPVHSSYTKVGWFYRTVGGEFNHILSSWDHNLTGVDGHGIRVSFDNRLSAGQCGDWRIVQTTSQAINLNQWYFGAVTFDFASGEMILYLDGVPVDTAIVPLARRDISDASLLVGATQGQWGWKGMLDDLRVYDHVLTPEQIAALYTDGDHMVVAGETADAQIWQTLVTGYSSTEASAMFASNTQTIGTVNQVPTLAAIGPRGVGETELLTFNVSATDPDGTTPSLSADPLPTNASFVDAGNGTGTFSFTPSYDQAGIYDILFIASDGVAADSELVTVTVTNLNRAPVLASIGAQSVAEGSILNLPISASDDDADSLVLSTGTLPENATFVDAGNGTGTLTFAPSFLQAGSYDILFIVEDQSLAADSELVTVTVDDTPQNALWLAGFDLTGETVGNAVNAASVQLGVQQTADEVWASPDPPEYTASLGILDSDLNGPFFRQIHEFGEDCYYWILEIDPHGNVAPPATPRCATLSWDPSEFSPDHNYVLRDGIDPDGAILVADMRTTTSYQICDVQSSHYVTVQWESSACADQVWTELNLTAGWNLVSLPVTPSSLVLADLIPTAEIAFEYNAGYQEVTELETCKGYWIRVPEAVTVELLGAPVTDCSQAQTTGWQLVGAPNCDVTPTTTPLGGIDALFGFNGAYVAETQTSAGGGYWVNLNTDCTLELACAATAPSAAPLAKGEASSSRVIIKAERQVDGDVSTAYVELGVDGSAGTMIAPPEAPYYSVKMNLYGSDWNGPYYRDIHSSDATSDYWLLTVNPCGNTNGVDEKTATLSWDPSLFGGHTYALVAGSNPNGPVVVEDMSKVTEYTVTGDNRDQFFTVLHLSNGDVLPESFALAQNYPNPFNPSTNIEFTIPVDAHVTVEVFNVLGQSVDVLADEWFTAGSHEVTWDASGVSTGVYLYRLSTSSFSETKKMLLLK